MSFGDQLEVLRMVTARLSAARILYMLTGSVALGYYAVPRMTRDLDLVVEVGPGDAERLETLFGDEFYLDADSLRRAVASGTLCSAIHVVLGIKVDLIVRKNTPYRTEEFARRRMVRVGDLDVWIVSPEDLLLSKLWWARESRSEIQIGDVRQLIAAQPTLEWPYIERCAAELGIGALVREVRG